MSISEGAIAVPGWQSCTDSSSFTHAVLEALSEKYSFSLDTPFEQYPKDVHDVLIYGTDGVEVPVHYRSQRGQGVYDVAFEGILKNCERKYRETASDWSKQELEKFMQITPCSVCKGQRLKPAALAVTVGGMNIHELTQLPIDRTAAFFEELKLTEQQELIGHQIVKEIKARISFLNDGGLNYLTLSRSTGSLSGG